MVDFVSGRAVIDAAQRKRGKYMAKCAAIGYGFFPFSFSSLGELEAGAVTLLIRIRKFSMAQDIGARGAVHIFNRISFAIAKGVFSHASKQVTTSVSSIGEECIQDEELWDLLKRKPHPICYDGFEPSWRMRMAHAHRAGAHAHRT
ncbi:putative reverse transcriptase domain-containing protein, partial [Tanacetum coccineum]